MTVSTLLRICLLMACSIPAVNSFAQDTDTTKTQLQVVMEGEEHDVMFDGYMNMTHNADDDSNWEEMEDDVSFDEMVYRKKMMPLVGKWNKEFLANNQLTGQWKERGSNNLAGSVKAVDYVKSTGALYLISAGGSLWKGTVTGSKWVILNQDIKCRPNFLKVIELGKGRTRIFVTFDEHVQYSDDEGETFQPSAGIDFDFESAKNKVVSITTLNDAAQSIYCLIRAKQDTVKKNRLRMLLYTSIDRGETFKEIYKFPPGADTASFYLNKPYNSNEVYALFDKTNPKGSSDTLTMYAINGYKVDSINTAFVTKIFNRQGCILKGFSDGKRLTQYVMIGNRAVYKSTDKGHTWQLRDTLEEKSRDRLDIGSNANTLFTGGVHAYRSIDGGLTWHKVNDWTEYYTNEAGKLHADIMDINSFKDAQGKPFTIISTHGGCYISRDDLKTTLNISLKGLNTAQFYDVLTDPDNTNHIFVATQDQGFQRAFNADSTDGPLNFSQALSGDYTSLTFTGNPKNLWIQNIQGLVFYCPNPEAPDSIIRASWPFQMPGKYLPNKGWMLPIAGTGKNNNEVYMGGGNVVDPQDSGSYLIKLTPGKDSILPFQFNYNFREHSRTGNAGISAVAVNKINNTHIYVATEDGTFFYSKDAGSTWDSTDSFNGPTPMTLYGGTILTSAHTAGKLWYAGSGYSNAAVYISQDEGNSFMPMSDGLPKTFVYKFAANPDETMLFAATEAGPYVYVSAEDKWYSMLGVNAPVESYTTVEYMASKNTVRFGTYGRGIWDFVIDNSVPLNLLSFRAAPVNQKTVQLTCNIAGQEDVVSFEMQRSYDTYQFSTIDSMPVSDDLGYLHFYNSQDNDVYEDSLNPAVAFYRIKMNYKSGVVRYSDVEAVRLNKKVDTDIICPAIAKDLIYIELNLAAGSSLQYKLTDASGKVLYDETKLYRHGISEEKIPIIALDEADYDLLITDAVSGTVLMQKTIKVVKQ